MMTIKVAVLGGLVQFTANQSRVEVSGSTVEEVLRAVERIYPDVAESICDEQGKVREFINVFVEGKDMRKLEGENTPVPDGSQIYIVPSVAGG